MSVLSRRSQFTVTDESGNTHRGSRETTKTVDGIVSDETFSVAASTTVTLYDSTVDSVSAFDFLHVESDEDVMLELITDQNNGVGKEVFTVTVTGGGEPFVLDSNVSYANYTTNFAGGTLDVIDKILCRNLGTETATVRRVVVT